MGDKNGGSRQDWRERVWETIEGAGTDLDPQGLMDLVEPELRDEYVQFGRSFPEEQLHLQSLYGEAQRAFEEKTRQSLRTTVQAVLRNVLRDQRLAGPEPDKYLAAYLEREILRIRVRLDQDGELAVNRGLNSGFALGMVLLIVPLLVGEKLLGLCDVSLKCTDRWSLLGALVCGGAGAFGAVLSVLTRLRNSGDQLMRRPANGSREAVPPGQQARVMRRGGVHRVFLGWLLAIAVYLLLGSGLVTVIEIPAGITDVCAPDGRADSAGTAFWGFWGAIGFLAGFNERWAYGLVGRGATSRKGSG
ncbi:hypothetical protein OG478_08315 [Streptomyces phaeochromogenes]|uniref:hypothetical protein n=1 Tax=Streptomyces phaeochromogenes TaxID=1923 RepID=UPI0038682EBA|nr:hypothetical protein OG478_08315 [Streptomyces phaeochromogenes]